MPTYRARPASPRPNPAFAPSARLRGFWSPAAPSPTLADLSGQGRTGTAGGTLAATPGAFGPAVDFGSGGYYDLAGAAARPLLAAGEPFTIAWAERSTGSSGFQARVVLSVLNSPSGRGFYVGRSTNVSYDEVYFATANATNNGWHARFPPGFGVSLSAAAALQPWQHFAVVGRAGPGAANAADFVAYLNGRPLDTLTSSFGAYSNAVNRIGYPGFDAGTNGHLDAVAVFGTALSPAQVASLAADPFLPIRPALTIVRIGAAIPPPAVAGSGSGTLGAVSGSAAGTSTDPGTGSATLGRVAGSAAGGSANVGSGSASLGRVAGQGSGSQADVGSGSGTLGHVAGSGSGGGTIAGAGSATLGPISAAGVGASQAPGTAIVDAGTTGYAVTGIWQTLPGIGRGGGLQYIGGGDTFDAWVDWTWAAVPEGNYEVQADWNGYPNHATDATYTITVDGTLAATVVIDQRAASAGTEPAGDLFFQALAVLAVPAGATVRLRLDGHGDGFVVADAARITPAAGIGSATLGPIAGQGTGSQANAGDGAGTLGPIVGSGSGQFVDTSTWGSGSPDHRFATVRPRGPDPHRSTIR